MRSIAVTGTDTGVGKTVVTASIAAALREAGVEVTCMKPVETGLPARSDAAFLREASGTSNTIEEICPIWFAPPLGPAVAAELEETEVDIARLDSAFTQLAASSDVVLVEGAGGLAAPVTWKTTFADLFARWKLPVLVVAQDKLGVLNHVALTLGAARSAGIEVVAIVLNAPDRSSVLPSNRGALGRIAGGIPVIMFPYVENARDISSLAAVAREAGLTALVTGTPES